MEQLRYEIDRHEGGVHVYLAGVLDLASRPTFAEVASTLLSEGDEPVTIDLSDIEFLDSTGIVELIRAARRAEQTGVRLRFVGPREGPARRTSEVVGLEKILGWDEPPER